MNVVAFNARVLGASDVDKGQSCSHFCAGEYQLSVVPILNENNKRL